VIGVPNCPGCTFSGVPHFEYCPRRDYNDWDGKEKQQRLVNELADKIKEAQEKEDRRKWNEAIEAAASIVNEEEAKRIRELKK